MPRPRRHKPSDPTQPILAGQYYDYLVRALTDYKVGRRNNAIMKGFAGQLSKQDIEDLAAWFSSQKSKLHDQLNSGNSLTQFGVSSP